MKRALIFLALVGLALAEAEEDSRLLVDPVGGILGLFGPLGLLGRLFEIAIQIVILVALSLLLGTLKPYVEAYMGEDYDYSGSGYSGYGASGYSGYYPSAGYDVGTSGSSYATTGSNPGGPYKRSVDTPLVQRLSARVNEAIETFQE